MNRRKIALNEEQDKLTNKVSKSKTEISASSKTDFNLPPFEPSEKLKLLVKKTNSPRNDPNNM